MAPLSDSLRRQLEKAVIAARDVAEAGAAAALERLAVRRPEPYAEMTPGEREVRVRLRAHARQLGDLRRENGEQAINRLLGECAYEHWHRMLFARFLAENQLLIHPDHGVPVTLAECEELAAGAGADDGWTLAGRFAARMLPAIFRPNDPVLSIRFAREHQHVLEALLAGLPNEVFTAADSLGWVYQFWQAKRKDQVNKSGKKIGAGELPAVTQLFTEPYMVQFLLHNTLGAWWAGKVLATRPELARTSASEEALRCACALPGYGWTYLRFVRAGEGDPWRPAAGNFEGWPERAADITTLDPCCGSGHFLAEAFGILVSMRMAEEGLTAREACDAVLRDNLFGLEIDERCTQIAAFNLALAAWNYPSAGGYRLLPDLHIACSGLAVSAREDEWPKLAGKNERLRDGMRRLYRVFKNAPTLGSLIDPPREEGDLLTAGFDALRPLLEQVLAREEVKRDAQATEAGITAQGMAKAAGLLAGSYTLVITNVPYLGRGKQADELKSFCDHHYPDSLKDLATVFVERGLHLVAKDCTVAMVTPHNWLSLKSYESLRRQLLTRVTLSSVVRLGPRAFETISGEVVNVALVVIQNASPERRPAVMAAVDVAGKSDAHAKRSALPNAQVFQFNQHGALLNPDARILFAAFDRQKAKLGDCCQILQGSSTGDDPKFVRCFWEFPQIGEEWRAILSAPDTGPASGRENVWHWPDDHCELARFPQARIRGRAAWGRTGFVVAGSARITATWYRGEFYNKLLVSVIPNTSGLEKAIWAFLESEDFVVSVRSLDTKNLVSPGAFANVPFDLAHWQTVSAKKYPNDLPDPESDDPTQWLFHGRPEASTAALQAAVARLLGYRWPAELDEKMRLSARARALVERCNEVEECVAADGIVCIPPAHGEQPASDRLQRLLARAFGRAWTPTTLATLLDRAAFAGRTLDDWLREGFYEQHCQLFHQRPFIWQIWDGRRRDGFGALVNYHKLDRRLLERLAYDVLGDWIGQQRKGVKAGERGSEDRLASAGALQRKLSLILEGESPYDIFVRWKPLRDQAIGWEPDLNDGVRMNIRPFVEAGVLRKNPKIQWTKDRGRDPEGLRPKTEFPWFWKDGRFTGERVNDVHVSLDEKRAAREGTTGAESGRR